MDGTNTAFFQSKAEFHEDVRLVRRAIREGWPVSVKCLAEVPRALSEVMLGLDRCSSADAVQAAEEHPFKAGHRVAAAALLMEMNEQNLTQKSANQEELRWHQIVQMVEAAWAGGCQ